MIRNIDLYPDYTAEIGIIEEIGISVQLLQKIIEKHKNNSLHSLSLYGRYKTLCEHIPIFSRTPRFTDEETKSSAINNRINNDFFSEIIDMKIGYFAGKPILYKYADDFQAQEITGGEQAVEKAKKELKDFVTRNNLFDIDIQITKFAAICGYAGRLFFVDNDSNIRVMAVHPSECILLFKNEMTDPSFAVRYYRYLDIDDTEIMKAEFYDEKYIYYYEGIGNALMFKQKRLHLFDFCPLQGIPNNEELLGDAEKVIAEIDDYDRGVSDNSNDIEGFANAYMVFKNADIEDETLRNADSSGVIAIEPRDSDAPYDVAFLTKNVNGTFVENHLNRQEENIYRFSKTPKLNDPKFNGQTGIALKIKMIGLETRCGTFEAKHQSASVYMFRLLESVFKKKRIQFDSLQCSATYRRNFPIDFIGDAQAVQALIAAGLPKQIAFRALSFIDDIDYVMRLIEEEKDGIEDLDLDDKEEETEEETLKLLSKANSSLSKEKESSTKGQEEEIRDG